MSRLVAMLFARSALSVLAQALVAGIYAVSGTPSPWIAAARWFPLYAVLIDAGCLVLLRQLTRREGSSLLDLVHFDRRRWRRDVLIGLALIPISLGFIALGISTSSELVYGSPWTPSIFRQLPVIAALYAVLVFPALWGFTEQLTYNGYLLPRLQRACRSTVTAIALVAFAWSLQHAFQPLTFDPKFMLYRALAPIPHSIFVCVAYLRIRRLLPFMIAHGLMDAGDAFVSVLLPLYQ
jgi:membrane protease YdiL (CAAX protease family)